MRCPHCKQEMYIHIQPGQVWKNDNGYRLKILDVGPIDFWCKWENGNRGSFNKEDFFRLYKLMEDC